jgi:peptidyl-prolyl cis-trans isomerase-like 4
MAAVLLETSIGDIVIDLKTDDAPKACLNFLKLCKLKYFNNCLFFKVQKDYIAQCGDPKNNGSGGASVFAKLPGLGQKYFKDEISPVLKHNAKGTIAMANEKPNENGSQFYITLRDKVEQLDQKHTIFGYVAEGLDVLDKMNSTMVDETSAPYQNIRIWHTEILEDPLPDPEGLEMLIPPKSPEVIKDEVFKSIDDAEDEAELQEKLAKTLAKSQATTLELLHDLPDAEIEVPDSDLFVTCMNPVTQDGDLELIFSRFGPIKSCEIVRDWKTGDSLQYGFITFENARDCEEAYFKMHDCVIDDRRIVVNFSQSVAKLWNKHRTGARMTSADARELQKGAKDRSKGKGKQGKPSTGKGKSDGEQNRSGKHNMVFESSKSSRHERRSRSREGKKIAKARSSRSRGRRR